MTTSNLLEDLVCDALEDFEGYCRRCAEECCTECDHPLHHDAEPPYFGEGATTPRYVAEEIVRRVLRDAAQRGITISVSRAARGSAVEPAPSYAEILAAFTDVPA